MKTKLFKKSAKIMTQLLSAGALIASVSTIAHAGTSYYIYQKGSSSTCDISTKDESQYNRGSSYHLLGSDSTRSGAKEIGEDAGCASF